MNEERAIPFEFLSTNTKLRWKTLKSAKKYLCTDISPEATAVAG
jgi:hypothetical protein